MSVRGIRGVRRFLAWAALVGGLFWAVGSVVSMGVEGLAAAVFAVGVSVAVAGVLRVEVRATPMGLVVCNGMTRREYTWAELGGFRVQTKGARRGVYALVGPDEVVVLPVPSGGLLPMEVGWRFDPAYWGRGFASEGAGAALREGFTTLELSEICSLPQSVNPRSFSVCERLGMAFQRSVRCPATDRRGEVEARMYVMSRAEWAAGAAAG